MPVKKWGDDLDINKYSSKGWVGGNNTDTIFRHSPDSRVVSWLSPLLLDLLNVCSCTYTLLTSSLKKTFCCPLPFTNVRVVPLTGLN